MKHKEIRKGITQAKFNEENSSILFCEIFIISVLLGVGFQSWWFFGGSFLGFIIAINIKPLAWIICILLSIVWAIIAFGIGLLFGSFPASVVLAVIAFLCGLGIHFSGLEWAEDLNN